MDSAIASSAAAPAYDIRAMGAARAGFAAMNDRLAAISAPTEVTGKSAGENSNDLSFGDLIDLINPLQHLPIIGSLYRDFTGDEINPAVKVIGGGLFGGPMGLAGGIFNAVVEQATGKDIETQVASLFSGSEAEKTALEDIKMADIQWNQVAPAGFGAPSALPVANQNTQIAASDAPKPEASALFETLKKGNVAVMPHQPASHPAFFNPMAAQYMGIQPVSAKTPTEVKTAGEAAANGHDTTQNPQSDFAKKMMDAMDRYQAGQKADAPKVAPMIDQGL